MHGEKSSPEKGDVIVVGRTLSQDSLFAMQIEPPTPTLLAPARQVVAFGCLFQAADRKVETGGRKLPTHRTVADFGSGA